MNLKKMAFFALLAGALLAYVFYFELPQSEKALKKEQLFAGLTQAQIESVAVSNKTGSFTLVNPEPARPLSAEEEVQADSSGNLAKWQLSDVQGSELDRGALNSLLNGIMDLKLQEPLLDSETETDPAIYGLSAPEVTLGIKTSSGTTEVKLGKKNDYLSKRYLSASDRAGIYLIPELLFTAASKSRTDFRNKAPVDMLDADISEISVQSGEKRIQLRAQEAGKWKLIEPVEAPASSSAVSGLTLGFRNLRAVEFIDDVAGHFSEYHLDKPDLKALISFKEGAKRNPLEVSISRVSAGQDASADSVASIVLVQGKPSLYKVSGDPLTTLLKPLDEYREKRLFEFMVDEVAGLEVQGDGLAPLALLKAGDKWTVNGKEADPVFARELVKNFSEIEATAFPLADRDFGFSSPRLKAVVRFAPVPDGKLTPEKTLVVGLPSEGATEAEKGFFAGADDLKTPFIISAQSLSKITPREDTLVKAQVTPEPVTAQASRE